MLKILFTYQIRSRIFITPIILFPILVIQYYLNIEILLIPFLILQNPFTTPLSFYAIPKILQKYFFTNRHKLLILFGLTTIFWYNFFYITIFCVIKLFLNCTNEYQFQLFEILLFTSVVLGIVIDVGILRKVPSFFVRKWVITFGFSVVLYLVYSLFFILK